MPLYGAIDIGSNAIRLIIAESSGFPELRVLEQDRAPIRLGRDVFETGIIQPPTMLAAIEGLQKLRAACRDHKFEKFRAVATSAAREASNSREFVRAIEQHVGLRVEVIDGREEARLVHLAVSAKVDLAEKPTLLLDVGGGSIELTVVVDGDPVWSDSFPLGTVRLLAILDKAGRDTKTLHSLLREYTVGARRQLARELARNPVERLVVTGGNAESLVSLRNDILPGKAELILKVEEIETISERLHGIPVREREKRFNLRADRADVIVPATLVILQIAGLASVKDVLIPRVGLREGVLLDLAGQPERSSGSRRQLMAMARRLGRKFDFDEEHGQCVARFAVEMFDATEELHGLSKRDRILLEVAALLHDIGQCISINDRHKHSYHILRHTNAFGLDNREQQIVAAIARYHRKGSLKPDHEAVSGLSEEEHARIEALTALVRLADGMDREYGRHVRGFEMLRTSPRAWRMTVHGEGDLLLERWALKAKAELFEKRFGVKLDIAE